MESNRVKKLAQYLLELSSLPDFLGLRKMRPDVKGPLGTTPLHVAATRGDIDQIRLLVEAGANINEKGEEEYTPLHEAVEQGQHEVAKVLVQMGCDLTAVNQSGLTPLGLAQLLNDEEMVEILRNAGGKTGTEENARKVPAKKHP